MGLRRSRFCPIRQEPIDDRIGNTAEIGDEPGGQKRPGPKG
jgi:hypothetical protein